MRKLVSVMMLTLALGAFAFSQAGAGGGGGGGGRGQRGGGGGGAQLARAGAQYGLLSHEDVQTALRLSDDQKAAITKAGADRRTAQQALFADQGADPAARTAAMTKLGSDYNAAVTGTLHDDQKTKLLGIFAVVAKNPALENPDVQTAIGLSSDEISKIKDLVVAEAKAGAALRQQTTDGTMDAAAARAARTKNAETLSTDLLGAISDAHKAAFEKLKSDAAFTPAEGVNYFGGGQRRPPAGGGGN